MIRVNIGCGQSPTPGYETGPLNLREREDESVYVEGVKF
jgi:hypothetical protein